MNLNENAEAVSSLNFLHQGGFLAAQEAQAFQQLFEPGSPLAPAINLAETLHLHIKVEDTSQLPIDSFYSQGASLDHQKEGFVKFRFPGSINAIFSHIKVSQDELLETPCNRRERPFLDHIGIDMRDETNAVRAAFKSLRSTADALNWRTASQGGPESPVFCCHVEVAEKHWLYPPDANGHPGIPLEFAYGALKVNPDKSGCDLRPTDPRHARPDQTPCCSG